MQRPLVTIPIVFVHGTLAGVHARGENFDVHLDDAGIDKRLLDEPGARVSADQYVALMNSLITRRDDECLGFLSRPLKRGSFALLVRSALGARDLETAIRRIARTFRLLQDDVTLELVRKCDLAGVALCFTNASATHSSFLDELLVRAFWRLFAWLADGSLPVAHFDFAFDSTLHMSSGAQAFPSPRRYGQPNSAFWFVAARLECRVRQSEASMHAFIAGAPANFILPKRAEYLVTARIRELMHRTLPLWPDLTGTANALHMSTATLQRRLAAEGTSFQAIKDELRRDMAIVRLSTSDTPVAVLAQELGFTDSATFQRAFKTWTGGPPGRYRRGDS